MHGLASTPTTPCLALSALAVPNPHPPQRDPQARSRALERVDVALAHAALLYA